MSRFGPLARREFRLLFLARGISFFGSAMAPVAIAFAVLDLTGSASDLGLVLAARVLPQILFLLVGAIFAAEAIGLVVGGALMLHYRPSRPLFVGCAAMFLMPPVLVLLALGAPLPLILAAALAMGLGIEIFSVMWETALQHHVPEHALSRVSSYDVLGSIVVIPLGQLAAGPIAEAIGVDEALYGAAAIVTVSTIAMVLTPDVRRLRRVEHDP